MATNFKRAIIRNPGKKICNAISTRGLTPDFRKAKQQHNQYRKVLENLGLKVHVLEPLEEFPDSVFVEDPALVINDICIILRPGVASRFGESKVLEGDLTSIFSDIYRIKNGKIEGGDILRIGSHFIVGLSERTNEEGARNLGEVLAPLGCTLEISKTPEGVLHFKSECSLISNDTILATEKLIGTGFFENKYRLLKVPKGEELGSNCLSINDHVLIPKGFNKIANLLSKEHKIIVVDVSEMEKADAGLSCMSLRS